MPRQKRYGRGGWFKESERHRLARLGVKTASPQLVQTFSPLLPLGYAKKSGIEIFNFQDKNQERVIHSGWEKGNSYRHHVLEASGDVFRKLAKEIPARCYIEEKLSRVESKIKDEENFTIHPDDSFDYSRDNNKQKFEKMIELWKKQPTNNDIQKVAVSLNLSVLTKDFSQAKKDIKKIRSSYPNYAMLKDRAKFYDSLWDKNKGVFYRGTSNGTGTGFGALGKGVYVAWKKGMARAFAEISSVDSGGTPKVQEYKLSKRLKLLDAQSKTMRDIKKMLGVGPYDKIDNPLFASELTRRIKEKGYDGVISDDVADGIVIFDKSKLILKKK